MMKSKRNIIAALLILLTAVPLNSVASALMVSGMSPGDEVAQAGMDMPVESPHHQGEMAHHHAGAAHNAFDHDTGDCDDYCMNCSTHCFSAALATVPAEIPDLDDFLSAGLDGNCLARAYLLFRPPIAA